MIFTSGAQALQGRTVNHDPEPWVGRHEGRRIANHVTQEQERVKSYDPRPEYAVLDNPILEAFRNDVEWHGVEAALEYDWPDYWMDTQDYTIEMVNHARRVLTRLAALIKEDTK